MNRHERRAAVAQHMARIRPALDALDVDEPKAVMLGRLIGPGPEVTGEMADETVLAGLHYARLELTSRDWPTDVQRARSVTWLTEHGFRPRGAVRMGA